MKFLIPVSSIKDLGPSIPYPVSRLCFTLIEVIASAAIFSVIIGVVYAVMITGTKVYDETSVTGGLESEAQNVLNLISDELMVGKVNTINDIITLDVMESGNAGSSITYQQNAGYSGAIQWSDEKKLSYYYDRQKGEGQLIAQSESGSSAILSRNIALNAEGEDPDNGMDDNKNGLIDEPGLAFQQNEDLLKIFLTLDQKDTNGVLHTKSVQTIVNLRNQGKN